MPRYSSADYDDAEDWLSDLLEEYPDDRSPRGRHLYRLIAGLFVDRLDEVHLRALTLSEIEILRHGAEWLACRDALDDRMDDDFDEDENVAYLNRLCFGAIHPEAVFNFDSAELILRACVQLDVDPSQIAPVLRIVFPRSRLWN